MSITVLLLAVAAAMIGFGLSRPGTLWLMRHFVEGRLVRWALVVGGIVAALLNAPLLLPGVQIDRAEQIIHIITLLLLGALQMALIFSARIMRAIRPARTTVLTVSAHPDDLELACGATLAKLADTGHEIHSLIMSRGQVGGDASIRPDEARAGGGFMGVSGMTVLDLPDTRLEERTNDMVRAIEDQIREHRPDLILTHSEHDQHQDHYAVHQAVLRAGRRHSSILCFESPSVTRSFNPSIYIDIGDYLGVKVRAIQMHADQAAKPYMTGRLVRAMAAFRGNQAKTRYAEAFEPVRMLAFDQGPLGTAGGGQGIGADDEVHDTFDDASALSASAGRGLDHGPPGALALELPGMEADEPGPSGRRASREQDHRQDQDQDRRERSA